MRKADICTKYHKVTKFRRTLATTICAVLFSYILCTSRFLAFVFPLVRVLCIVDVRHEVSRLSDSMRKKWSCRVLHVMYVTPIQHPHMKHFFNAQILHILCPLLWTCCLQCFLLFSQFQGQDHQQQQGEDGTHRTKRGHNCRSRTHDDKASIGGGSHLKRPIKRGQNANGWSWRQKKTFSRLEPNSQFHGPVATANGPVVANRPSSMAAVTVTIETKPWLGVASDFLCKCGTFLMAFFPSWNPTIPTNKAIDFSCQLWFAESQGTFKKGKVVKDPRIAIFF